MSQEGLFIPMKEGQLFAIYQAALMEKEMSEGVLIVPPAPFEMRRTQRAQRNLAQNLSKKGFHTLRFDYRGTGDSFGTSTDWSIQNWMADIRAAADHLRNAFGIQRISVVGTRLGGTLALKALEGQALRRFILWDPIVRGKDYYAQLEESHRFLVSRESDKPPYDRGGRLQCLGFALNETWIAELKELVLDPGASARGFIIQSEKRNDLMSEMGNLKVVTIDDDQQWADPILLQMQSFAHPSLTAIEKACEGKL
ncbi:MAG: alpha/beta fold hydrolase [Proteobacteria bacterium]|nr:MAG: alpha/beta fold hydrolase [Pseudomonadota bacterium]